MLEQVDVFLLPRINPDGAALGQRAAADGVDLNRDHLLLRTPEARAQAQLERDVAPLVVLDLHEYPVDSPLWTARFGGVRRADASCNTRPPATCRRSSPRRREWFRAPLAAGPSAPLHDDGSHREHRSGRPQVSMGGVGAQLGRNAAGLKNAVGLLVETRGGGLGGPTQSARAGARRRRDQRAVECAAHAADLVKLRQFVERDVAAKLPGEG